MNEKEAIKLALGMDKSLPLTFSPTAEERENDPLNLGNFPPLVLSIIFSHIGSNSSNPSPSNHCHYLAARNEKDYEERKRAPNENEMFRKLIGFSHARWNRKWKNEYAIRNLMKLRQVCSKFEHIINNMMIPGKDYDIMMVDLKLKRDPRSPRGLMMYKYGGDGNKHPCRYLKRIGKLDEEEHLQKFEKIENLFICDMILSEELFDTILRLDLTKTKDIRFEKITGLNFDESINIQDYIQNFMEKLDSSASLLFDSEVFNPNFMLFRQEKWEENGIEALGIRDFYDFNLDRQVQHKTMIAKRRKKKETYRFRGFRLLNLINTFLISSPKRWYRNSDFSSAKRREICKMEVRERVKNLLKNESEDVKNAGLWHLEKVLESLDQQPVKDHRSVLFHLKMIRKIADSDGPVAPETAIPWKEAEEREKMLNEFTFLEKFQAKSRIYKVRK